MNDDVIADLKQFITTTMSQQMSNVATKDDIAAIRAEMATKDDVAQLDKKLSAKIDDLQTSVSEVIDIRNDAVDTQLRDHERRITRLEPKLA